MVRALSIACLAILCGHPWAHAQSGPRPPCGADPAPPYPGLADSPAVKFWSASELANWRPPACTGWTGEGFSTLVTTVARFRDTSGMEGLLRRSGAVSSLAGLRYWSTTHGRWQTLISDAFAVTGVNGERRRDFTLAELKPGAELYFQQADNLSGGAIYKLHIAEATPDRLEFDVDNVTPVKLLLLTLFRRGEMQSVYFLDRESEGVWRYYSMTRTGKDSSGLTAGHEASWINRAVAFFRHVAGIPSDREPPAAR